MFQKNCQNLFPFTLHIKPIAQEEAGAGAGDLLSVLSLVRLGRGGGRGIGLVRPSEQNLDL